QKFLGRSHKGFQQAEGELEQMLSQLIVSNSPSVDSSTLFDREPRIWQLPYS
ncbi:TPA: IS256 family transposase, partial [Enterococcus faecalis]|nr:IS256 family transposase [Enterococcus faecalis]HAP4540664.1 IS256 family transposase [Enterococcus faecalis]HAP4543537.1 IS256 family transposase [Enterococcus faecalis]HAP4729174.1 IS256 family transposase [Enterococcus faecalis]HAP4768669.1 IS256 family transposase [Enterococcus faecalis]